MMYSENIIFFDAEFTQLSATGTQFLSLALIANTDKQINKTIYAPHSPKSGSEFMIEPELYIELPFNETDCNSWVLENVVPNLKKTGTAKTYLCSST